ncbi:ACT domain-containing protein, partial [Arthrospira platensis SPKY1]|nr:ACT domain-containing protein [Arthrospira platensis SPKY1]
CMLVLLIIRRRVGDASSCCGVYVAFPACLPDYLKSRTALIDIWQISVKWLRSAASCAFARRRHDMKTSLILTLIGPDRPGLVNAVSQCATACGANWMESRMAHLA